ncbi:MAG: GAF domain-containing protein, partial [Phycisphaeraceae bacterium]|nr:GAF domain-containing protein [Phycisphaeraceae bacterium]
MIDRAPSADASSTPSPPPGGAGAGVASALSGGQAPSIRHFVTDGSIARLCDEIGSLAGVPVWLRDTDGTVISPADPDAPQGPLWRVLGAQEGARRAYARVGRPYREGEALFVAPLKTSIGDLGSIVMPIDGAGADAPARPALERALTILASAAVESCEGAIAIQRRVDELDALFRLSSMLTHARDPDRVLETVLDVALETLRCDAGSIAVLDDTTGELRHRFTRGLSHRWLADGTPLSIDGALRERALAGDVVVVADLRHDPRIADPSRPRAEGLVGLITTGLIEGGRPAGQIRLYTRTPRDFSPSERQLLRSLADHAAMTLAHARLRVLR